MHRLIKAACAIAAEDIGKARAERIAASAQKRYEELCRENVSDSKVLRAHTHARIYPGIAVYEALRADGVERELAVWVLREYFQRFSARFVPHLQRAIRVLGLAKIIPGLFMKISLGHLCYLIDDELLFTGDSIALNKDGGWCFFDIFNYDSRMNIASLQALRKKLDLGKIRYLFTSHNGYTDDPQSAFRHIDTIPTMEKGCPFDETAPYDCFEESEE
jgi:hypothetical protein